MDGMPKTLTGDSYDEFVRRHWGRHPKTGPAPDQRVFRALAHFANVTSAITVMLAQREVTPDLFVACAGLIGETGEIAEHVKKHVRDGVLDREKLRLELGDVMFYLTRLTHVEEAPEQMLSMAHHALDTLIQALGFTVAEGATANIEKLEARHGV